MTRPGPSEQDRLAAARAWYVGMGYEDADQIERLAEAAVATGRYDPIVDSAFAAGWRARVPEGSEEREEFGVNLGMIDLPDSFEDWTYGSRASAQGVVDEHAARLAENPAWSGRASLRQRRLITTPWCPVEEEA